MLFCPKCGAGYEKNATECNDCGVPLVGDEEYRKIQEIAEEFHQMNLAELKKTPYAQEAMSWRDFLLSSGFKVITEPEVGHVDPLPAAPLSSEYRLLIPEDQLGDARKELDDYLSGREEDEFSGKEEND